MHARLTYIFFFSLAALLISSCESETPGNIDLGKGTEMSFDVSNSTRASVTSSFNKFAVYGDMKFFSDNNVVNPIILFNKTEVEYIDNSWTYKGATQYWLPRHEHTFVAISPLSVLETGTPLYSNSRLSFIYSIPTTEGKLLKNNDVTDIIAATHRRLFNDNDENTTATFHFGHILSLINIAPELDDKEMRDDDVLKIHKLELSGFSTTATINIIPALRQSNSQTDDWVIDIDKYEGEGVFSVSFTTPIEVKNHDGKVYIFDANDAIIMLPQLFAADSQAKIVLTYTMNDGSQESLLTVPLKRIRWESGKSYTYRLLLDKYGLKLETMTISDWEETTVDFNATIE